MKREDRKKLANWPAQFNHIGLTGLRLILVSACLIILGGGSSLYSILPVGAASPTQDYQESQDGLWQEVDEATLLANQAERSAVAQSYRTIRLNQEALMQRLSQAPMEYTEVAQSTQVVMTLPMPDRTFARFRIEESPVMEPELAAQFPEIKSYRGQGIDDSSITVRFDWAPQGFHALMISGENTVVIHPHRLGDINNYVSYYGRDYKSTTEAAICLVPDEPGVNQAIPQDEVGNNVPLGSIRRTYRVAIAVTQEYANAPALGGGTVNGTLASINTRLNSLNLIYERELSVRLNLVANNTAVIYTAEPDPFTNGNGQTMLEQVRDALRDRIGDGNYDIGHVLGTGGGGIAYINGACSNRTDGDSIPRGPRKGGGVTLLKSDGAKRYKCSASPSTLMSEQL